MGARVRPDTTCYTNGKDKGRSGKSKGGRGGKYLCGVSRAGTPKEEGRRGWPKGRERGESRGTDYELGNSSHG